jgi:hypothetical protein
VLPKRRVVERPHAWNECWRRMVMHHDRRISTSTAWVWLAEARIPRSIRLHPLRLGRTGGAARADRGYP